MQKNRAVRASRSVAAFSLIELLAVLAIIAILVTVLVPVTAKIREQSRMSRCVTNLREWGLANLLYAEDHNDLIPWDGGTGAQPDNLELHEGTLPWFNALPPYLGSPTIQELNTSGNLPRFGDSSIFICPSAQSRSSAAEWLCYGPNYLLSLRSNPGIHRVSITRLSMIREPNRVPLFAETTNHASDDGFQALNANPNYLARANRHQDRAPVVFFDGHVETFTSEELAIQGRVWDNPNAPVRVRWNPKHQ